MFVVIVNLITCKLTLALIFPALLILIHFSQEYKNVQATRLEPLKEVGLLLFNEVGLLLFTVT